MKRWLFPVVFVAAVIGWLFGMQWQPGWFAAGTAVIVLSWIFGAIWALGRSKP